MSDLIKREDAMAIAFKSPFFSNALMEEFKTIPTIDAVSVVHGEWIDEHEDGHGSWVGTCSQCHNTERVANFCPNCGADMRGERDE